MKIANCIIVPTATTSVCASCFFPLPLSSEHHDPHMVKQLEKRYKDSYYKATSSRDKYDWAVDFAKIDVEMYFDSDRGL